MNYLSEVFIQKQLKENHSLKEIKWLSYTYPIYNIQVFCVINKQNSKSTFQSHHYSSWKILFFIFTLFSRISLRNVFVLPTKKGHRTELEGKIRFFSLKALFSSKSNYIFIHLHSDLHFDWKVFKVLSDLSMNMLKPLIRKIMWQ